MAEGHKEKGMLRSASCTQNKQMVKAWYSEVIANPQDNKMANKTA